MRKKNIFISSLVILVIIELAVLFLLSSQIYKKQTNTAAIISPIKKEHIIFPGNGELNIFEYKPNSVIGEPGLTETTITINSDGLNERFEYTIDKPKDTFRIIVLGDSFTSTHGVNTQDTYPEVLEDLLNDKLHCKNLKKFEVINFGVYGYNIKYSVERFRLRGQKYNPDLMLWLLINNDFEIILEFVIPRYNFYNDEIPDQSYIENSWNWDKAVEDQYTEIGEEKIMWYQEEALRSINNYYENRLVFFTVQLRKKFRLIIEEFIKSRGNAYLLQERIFKYQDKYVLPTFHPNKEAHALFAKNIFDYFTKNNIIPCD